MDLFPFYPVCLFFLEGLYNSELWIVVLTRRLILLDLPRVDLLAIVRAAWPAALRARWRVLDTARRLQIGSHCVSAWHLHGVGHAPLGRSLHHSCRSGSRCEYRRRGHRRHHSVRWLHGTCACRTSAHVVVYHGEGGWRRGF